MATLRIGGEIINMPQEKKTAPAPKKTAKKAMPKEDVQQESA